MTARTKPPFRADHVGSILRSAAIKDARASHAAGKLGDAGLKEIEDREIEKVIRKQEEVGLKLATDGEFRRAWWQFDFFKGLEGAELYSTGGGIKFAGVETKAESVTLDHVLAEVRELRAEVGRLSHIDGAPNRRTQDHNRGAAR